ERRRRLARACCPEERLVGLLVRLEEVEHARTRMRRVQPRIDRRGERHRRAVRFDAEDAQLVARAKTVALEVLEPDAALEDPVARLGEETRSGRGELGVAAMGAGWQGARLCKISACSTACAAITRQP